MALYELWPYMSYGPARQYGGKDTESQLAFTLGGSDAQRHATRFERVLGACRRRPPRPFTDAEGAQRRVVVDGLFRRLPPLGSAVGVLRKRC